MSDGEGGKGKRGREEAGMSNGEGERGKQRGKGREAEEE